MKTTFIATITALSLALAGCSSTPKTNDYTQYTHNALAAHIDYFAVEMTNQKALDFRGIYDPNNTVEGSQILYAGVGTSGAGIAASVLTQIFLHEGINNTAQRKKLQAQQRKANLALTPIQEKLATLTPEMLTHAATDYGFENTATQEYRLKTTPVFFFSQDLTTLSIKNVVTLVKTAGDNTEQEKKKSKKKGATDSIYENLIEVHHVHFPKEDTAAYINTLSNAELQHIVQTLYKQSIELAINDINGLGLKDKPEQSFKIYNGTDLQLERGKLFKEDCDKHILQNLRGWLIAYPKSADDKVLQVASCAAPANATKNT